MKYKNNYLNSFYSPFLTLDKKTRVFINNRFILKKVEVFFKEIKIDRFKELNEKYVISDIFFKNISFESLYEEFFDDLVKENDEIIYTVKYSITFNKNLTSSFCEKTNIYFSEINIFNKPIFYLIYIDSFENIIRSYEDIANSVISKNLTNYL